MPNIRWFRHFKGYRWFPAFVGLCWKWPPFFALAKVTGGKRAPFRDTWIATCVRHLLFWNGFYRNLRTAFIVNCNDKKNIVCSFLVRIAKFGLG